MNRPASIMVRVKLGPGCTYLASTMIVGAGRKQASSTSSAESALRCAAAKGLACAEDQIVITPFNGSDLAGVGIGGQWHAFDCAVKGTATQMDLLPGGAS
jgi:hypothetical protein